MTKTANNFDRWIAAFIDFVLWQWFIAGPFILLFAITSGTALQPFFSYGYGLSFLFYLTKDSLWGRSPGKMNAGILILDRNTQTPASDVQMILRNATVFLLFPLECLVLLFSPKRRIGDRLAGTVLVYATPMSFSDVW